MGDLRALMLSLHDAAVQRALPAHSMAAFLPPPPGGGGRTLVLGAGKAGGSMGAALVRPTASPGWRTVPPPTTW